MEHTETRDRTLATAIRISLGLALLWAVLAAVRPGTTFHLAPVLVAAAVPWVHRVQDPPALPTAIRPAVLGLGMAVGASMLLAAAGLLDGPSLLPFGGAFEESLVGAVVGSLIGLVVAATPRRVGVG